MIHRGQSAIFVYWSYLLSVHSQAMIQDIYPACICYSVPIWIHPIDIGQIRSSAARGESGANVRKGVSPRVSTIYDVVTLIVAMTTNINVAASKLIWGNTLRQVGICMARVGIC